MTSVTGSASVSAGAAISGSASASIGANLPENPTPNPNPPSKPTKPNNSGGAPSNNNRRSVPNYQSAENRILSENRINNAIERTRMVSAEASISSSSVQNLALDDQQAATQKIYWPTDHPVITDVPGTPRGYGQHTGYDIRSGHGNIYAMADGTVVQAGWKGGYGYCMTIDHGNGYKTFYAHLSELNYSKDQEVKGGQAIGKGGATGGDYAPHLHLDVYFNGKKTDPTPLLAVAADGQGVHYKSGKSFAPDNNTSLAWNNAAPARERGGNGTADIVTAQSDKGQKTSGGYRVANRFGSNRDSGPACSGPSCGPQETSCSSCGCGGSYGSSTGDFASVSGFTGNGIKVSRVDVSSRPVDLALDRSEDLSLKEFSMEELEYAVYSEKEPGGLQRLLKKIKFRLEKTFNEGRAKRSEVAKQIAAFFKIDIKAKDKDRKKEDPIIA